MYFWRDQKGHEVDMVADNGTSLYPTEVKSSETFHKSFLKNVTFFSSLQDAGSDGVGKCIYGGDESFSVNEWKIRSWRDI